MVREEGARGSILSSWACDRLNADRRSFQVRLTPRGRKLYRGARERFLAHLAPLLATRPPAAQRQILQFLDELIPAIRQWRDEVRTR